MAAAVGFPSDKLSYACYISCCIAFCGHRKGSANFHGKKTQWINYLVTFVAFTLGGEMFLYLFLPGTVLPFRLILQQYCPHPNAVRLPHFYYLFFFIFCRYIHCKRLARSLPLFCRPECARCCLTFFLVEEKEGKKTNTPKYQKTRGTHGHSGHTLGTRIQPRADKGERRRLR